MKALILGGVKSGKSLYAETLAQQVSDQVSLIATATALDDEMAARIARHQADRPSSWKTTEAPIHLADALQAESEAEVVVIDCLTLWITNLLMTKNKALIELELERFEEQVKHFSKPLIMVANETSMGIMPLGELARQFCDQAGMLHQRLARICDRVELVVAGLPLQLKFEIH